MFTDPPLGRVGMGLAEARRRAAQVLKAEVPMSSVSRALLEGETTGLMRILVDADTEEFLGATILGLHADDLMQIIGIAMQAGVQLPDGPRRAADPPDDGGVPPVGAGFPDSPAGDRAAGRDRRAGRPETNLGGCSEWRRRRGHISVTGWAPTSGCCATAPPAVPFIAAFIARLPISMAPLGILLLIEHDRGAYADRRPGHRRVRPWVRRRYAVVGPADGPLRAGPGAVPTSLGSATLLAALRVHRRARARRPSCWPVRRPPP